MNVWRNQHRVLLVILLALSMVSDAAVGSNPTFGYTTLGGSTEYLNSEVCGSSFTLNQAGTVSQISVGCRANASVSVTAAIYDSSLKLVATGTPTVCLGNDIFRWVNVSISATLNSGTYWLVARSNSQTGSFKMAYDSGASGTEYGSGSYPTFPSTLTGFSTNTKQYSIFATYAAVGSNPTFGYTTLGGSTEYLNSEVCGSSFTLNQAGTVSQ
ncbi:MAG: hypothetical protein ABSA79_12650, partial [Candidatus Bathyarchaeia archaeon]